MNFFSKFYLKFKGSFLFVSATFLVQGINAITLPIFTRLLTQADFGILSASNSIQNFSTAAFRLGAHQAILKKYIEIDEKRREQYFFSIICFSFIWSLLLIGFFVGFNALFKISIFEGVEFYPYLLIPLLISGFSVSYAVFQSLLRILNLGKRFLIITIVYVVSSVVLSVLLIKIFDLGVLGKLIGNLIPFLLIFLYLVIKTKQKPKIKYWLDAIKFGGPLSISAIISSLILIYAVSYLSHSVSLEDLGKYQIGRNLGLFIPQFMFQAITLTYVPFIYRKLSEKKKEEIIPINSLIVLFFVIGIVFAIFLTKYIVLLFTTAEYLSTILLIQVFFGSYIFKIFYFFPMISLFSENKTSIVSYSEIGSSVIFIILLHFLVPINGILGVAIAFLIQEALKMIVIIYYSNLNYYDIFNIKYIKKI